MFPLARWLGHRLVFRFTGVNLYVMENVILIPLNGVEVFQANSCVYIRARNGHLVTSAGA